MLLSQTPVQPPNFAAMPAAALNSSRNTSTSAASKRFKPSNLNAIRLIPQPFRLPQTQECTLINKPALQPTAVHSSNAQAPAVSATPTGSVVKVTNEPLIATALVERSTSSTPSVPAKSSSTASSVTTKKVDVVVNNKRARKSSGGNASVNSKQVKNKFVDEDEVTSEGEVNNHAASEADHNLVPSVVTSVKLVTKVTAPEPPTASNRRSSGNSNTSKEEEEAKNDDDGAALLLLLGVTSAASDTNADKGSPTSKKQKTAHSRSNSTKRTSTNGIAAKVTKSPTKAESSDVSQDDDLSKSDDELDAGTAAVQQDADRSRVERERKEERRRKRRKREKERRRKEKGLQDDNTSESHSHHTQQRSATSSHTPLNGATSTAAVHPAHDAASRASDDMRRYTAATVPTPPTAMALPVNKDSLQRLDLPPGSVALATAVESKYDQYNQHIPMAGMLPPGMNPMYAQYYQQHGHLPHTGSQHMPTVAVASVVQPAQPAATKVEAKVKAPEIDSKSSAAQHPSELWRVPLPRNASYVKFHDHMPQHPAFLKMGSRHVWTAYYVLSKQYDRGLSTIPTAIMEKLRDRNADLQAVCGSAPAELVHVKPKAEAVPLSAITPATLATHTAIAHATPVAAPQAAAAKALHATPNMQPSSVPILQAQTSQNSVGSSATAPYAMALPHPPPTAPPGHYYHPQYGWIPTAQPAGYPFANPAYGMGMYPPPPQHPAAAPHNPYIPHAYQQMHHLQAMQHHQSHLAAMQALQQQHTQQSPSHSAAPPPPPTHMPNAASTNAHMQFLHQRATAALAQQPPPQPPAPITQTPTQQSAPAVTTASRPNYAAAPLYEQMLAQQRAAAAAASSSATSSVTPGRPAAASSLPMKVN